MEKKKSNKKPTSKTNISKNTKKKTTNTSSKRKPQVKKETKTLKEKVLNKTNLLYVLFFGLLILVIILGVNVYKAEKKDEKTANIVVPITKKNSSSELKIDLKELSKEKEYAIKIANYRLNDINQEKIDYTITIENESKAYIKVTKDNDKNNLITDQESTRIEGVSLKGGEKDSSIYHFSVIDKKSVEDGEKINITIESLQ